MTAVRVGDARQQRLTVEESSQVGEVRRAVERITSGAAFCDVARGRAAIAASELATNLVRHATGGGEILLQLVFEDEYEHLEILAIDRGPGMDVERCMRDGYSTGGTAGNGLGAVARLSAVFDVYSVAQEGTVVLARLSSMASPAPLGSRRLKVAIGAVSVAVRGEIENGDTWRAAYSADHVALLVVDGLGHGPLAANASNRAALDFVAKPFRKPDEALTAIHQMLAGTRGAAASCALIDRHSKQIRFAGVGNVSGFVYSAGRAKGMACHNGTLGVAATRIRCFEYEIPPSALVILHSDGLQTRWSLEQHVGLAQRHPAVIAAVLYRQHARSRDDVTVVIAKAA